MEVDPMVYEWARRDWDTRAYHIAFLPKYLRFNKPKKLPGTQ
jgi:hypothetical protein